MKKIVYYTRKITVLAHENFQTFGGGGGLWIWLFTFDLHVKKNNIYHTYSTGIDKSCQLLVTCVMNGKGLMHCYCFIKTDTKVNNHGPLETGGETRYLRGISISCLSSRGPVRVGFVMHLSRRLKCTIAIMHPFNFSHFQLLLWNR